LCIAKLAASREKDLDFVGALLRTGIVEPKLLVQRIGRSAIPVEQRKTIEQFVRRFAPEDPPVG